MLPRPCCLGPFWPPLLVLLRPRLLPPVVPTGDQDRSVGIIRSVQVPGTVSGWKVEVTVPISSWQCRSCDLPGVGNLRVQPAQVPSMYGPKMEYSRGHPPTAGDEEMPALNRAQCIGPQVGRKRTGSQQVL